MLGGAISIAQAFDFTGHGMFECGDRGKEYLLKGAQTDETHPTEPRTALGSARNSGSIADSLRLRRGGGHRR